MHKYISDKHDTRYQKGTYDISDIGNCKSTASKQGTKVRRSVKLPWPPLMHSNSPAAVLVDVQLYIIVVFLVVFLVDVQLYNVVFLMDVQLYKVVFCFSAHGHL